MTAEQLAHVAAFINTAIRWRFSWSRLATVERIKSLEIPTPPKSGIGYPVKELLPARGPTVASDSIRLNLRPHSLDSLFTLQGGYYHSTAELQSGDIPLISCGERSNGICAFVDAPDEQLHSYKLTIAFNGMNTLNCKFHPYEFAAKDDVAVCTPIRPLRTATLFFIQLMLRQEQWRFNFYRKCFLDKLQRQQVRLPSNQGQVDEDAIESIVGCFSYWPYLKKRLTPPPPAVAKAG